MVEAASHITDTQAGMELRPDAPNFYADQQPLQLEGTAASVEAPMQEEPGASPVLPPPRQVPVRSAGEMMAAALRVGEAAVAEEARRKRARVPEGLSQITEDAWQRVDPAARAFIQRQLHQGRKGVQAYRQVQPPARQRACLEVLRVRMTSVRQVQAQERIIRQLGYSVFPVKVYTAVPLRKMSAANIARANQLGAEILSTANM